MSRRGFVAVFSDGEALLAAARAARAAGYDTPDAYTPHPVHGLEEALGLRPSRLSWVCFLGGLAGALFMTAFQLWTTAVDWRLNVGGRPWNSSLSFACVSFEVMVLLAGLGSVIALLVVCRLRPGRAATMPAAGVTDDRFALLLTPRDAEAEPGRAPALLAPFRPLEVTECVLGEGGR